MAVFSGDAFLNWLAQHQVLSPQTKRVIIDAEVGKPVRIYVEQFMDSAVLDFTPPTELREVAISFAERTDREPRSDALATALSVESANVITRPGARPGASETEPASSR